jgi:hypothetical protein
MDLERRVKETSGKHLSGQARLPSLKHFSLNAGDKADCILLLSKNGLEARAIRNCY